MKNRPGKFKFELGGNKRKKNILFWREKSFSIFNLEQIGNDLVRLIPSAGLNHKLSGSVFIEELNSVFKILNREEPAR